MSALSGTSTNTTPAVKGENTGTSFSAGRGVWGESSEHDGVAGYSSSSTRYAGYFKNLSDGPGVYGENAGTEPAVKGVNTGTGESAGRGLWGHSEEHDGVAGYSNSSGRYAAYFKNLGDGPGLYAENSGADPAIQGVAVAGVGVKGFGGAGGVGGFGGTTGVYGEAGEDTYSSGVYGVASNLFGVAVFGTIYGDASWAGFFEGNVSVTGDLYVDNVYKSGGGFIIDHPLDPANRTLVHSFVESPERKNLYDGTGVTDQQGELVVTLPAYFEALNSDIRYQLTPVGMPAPNLHVKTELSNGSFTIGGGAPGQRVCWQVTGNRKDAWAVKNPLVPEVTKSPEHVGRYWSPTAFGEPMSKHVHWFEKKTPFGAAPGSRKP